MHKWTKVMWLHGKLLAGRLYPVATAHAAGLRGKRLLLLPSAQVFDDAVGIHQVETLVCKRQPRTVTNDRGVIRLHKENFVFVNRLKVQNGYLRFDRHALPS